MKKFVIMSKDKLDQIINNKVNEYVKLKNKDYEREFLKKQVDIATLQNQINPHFLYNSLECIRGQALLNNVPEIAETTLALSKFFRYGINTKSDLVTLRDELDSVDNYMKIQQFRFKDCFTLEIEYDRDDPHLLDAILPKLTFQPIIENAIKHGFKNNLINAIININITRTKRHLNITISDNGQGMSWTALSNLNQKLTSDNVEILKKGDIANRGSGIAMYNVNKRIKLIFGDDYGIHFSSVVECGTDVEIHIPFQIDDNAGIN